MNESLMFGDTELRYPKGALDWGALRPLSATATPGRSHWAHRYPQRGRLTVALSFAIAASALSMRAEGADAHNLFADGFDHFGPVLRSWIHNRGTVVQCVGAWPSPLPLLRDGATPGALPEITCPSSNNLPDDFVPSLWTMTDPVSNRSEQARTQIPDPLVLRLGELALVLGEPWAVNTYASIQLDRGNPVPALKAAKSGAPLLRIDHGDGSSFSSVRWLARANGHDYVSREIDISPLPIISLGYGGALTIGDLLPTGIDELIGESYAAYTPYPYDMLGLGQLFAGGSFTDMKVADFDGDGIDDVISNTYNVGCAVVGLNRIGSFVFNTPLRSDDSCIDGHGESIAIADFDEDGDTDAFLPAYERFNLLMNQGNGTFIEVAEASGVMFPNYLPRPEGTAAVDINRDGHVDIVVASEILLNDGDGVFSQSLTPFGPDGLFDEGMSVADLDADGYFDIVKHDPMYGPRVFWGTATSGVYVDSNWLLGGAPVLVNAFGLSVGDISGNGLMDIVAAGGDTGTQSPVVCAHLEPRNFSCILSGWPANPERTRSVLTFIADFDGNGTEELAFTFGPGGLIHRAPGFARKPRYSFSFDLVDAGLRRRMHGRSFEVSCADDGELMALRAVPGGNGYLTQARYAVSVGSDYCHETYVSVDLPSGRPRFGPFEAGDHVINVFAGS